MLIGRIRLLGRPFGGRKLPLLQTATLNARHARSFSSYRLFRLRRSIDDDIIRGRLDEHNLRQANSIDPRITVRAVEANYPNAFPKDEGVLKEYLKALMITNRLDSRSLKPLLQQETATSDSTEQKLAESIRQLLERNEMYLKTDDKNPLHVVVAPQSRGGFMRFLKALVSFGSIAFCFGSIYILMSQNLHRGINYTFNVVNPEDIDTTFADVKGCDEVKSELDEVVEYLRKPERFDKIGAKLPKGVLLAGPPGTGKTLLARAVAGEAGVPFIQASGSEFEEMFVGVGARRIRELFKTAKSMAPCIVFIDELDAVGSKRSATDHNSVRMTLNQLLVELDGFSKRDGVVVLCATNFPESLDPALVRPGRLDRTIHIPLPDYKGRYDILKLYSKKITVAPDVDLSTFAKRTVGMTGADIFNILNMAALKCSIQGLAAVTSSAIEEAFDRVVVGLKGKSLVSEREKKATAYHEGGHTLVSLHSKDATKVHKATIAPRGNTLGVTWKIPEEKSDTRMTELKAEIDVLMGGMAAEEVIYGKENVSTGCQSDLQKATEIARMMVMQFGVGLENVNGPMYLDAKGYSNLSEEHRERIDTAVQGILNDGYKRASGVIRNNIAQLHNLCDALVHFETLSADEINHAIHGEMREIEQKRLIQQNELKAQLKRYQAPKEKKTLIPETQPSYRA